MVTVGPCYRFARLPVSARHRPTRGPDDAEASGRFAILRLLSRRIRHRTPDVTAAGVYRD
jgi:hypothetical protein